MANAATPIKDESALHPSMRAKWQRVKARLEAQGYQPVIASAWRDPATQASLHASGASQVSFSFHQAVDAAGNPAAQAIDAIDKRYGWGTSATRAKAAAFFMALGAAAKAEGLYWGGDWSRSNPTWAAYNMGWDPAHIQLQPNSALSQVKEATLHALAHPAETLAAGAKLWVGAWIGVGVLGTAFILWRRSRAQDHKA